MKNLKDLLKKHKDNIKEFAEECEDTLIGKGYIKTKNFGWILIKDYENYSFLKRDSGVPSEKKWHAKDQKFITVIAQEYFDWKNSVEKRNQIQYARSQNMNELVKTEDVF